jgi:hypothetical protein
MSPPRGRVREEISIGGGITYAGQSSLPRLPIPTLEETLERFPDVVSAFLNKKEMKECREEITKFLETDGPALQKLLVEYDRRGEEKGTVGSFVEEFWTDAYLAPDSSVVMNLNPFFVLEVRLLRPPDDSLCRGLFPFFVPGCRLFAPYFALSRDIHFPRRRTAPTRRRRIPNPGGPRAYASPRSNSHPP